MEKLGQRERSLLDNLKYFRHDFRNEFHEKPRQIYQNDELKIWCEGTKKKQFLAWGIKQLNGYAMNEDKFSELDDLLKCRYIIESLPGTNQSIDDKQAMSERPRSTYNNYMKSSKITLIYIYILNKNL